jgi:hypothetical protein
MRYERKTMVFALSIAVVADVLQWLAGPLGFWIVDPLIDIAAAILITKLLGFHALLLPTFVTELIPVANLLPTWTGCVIALIAIRKRENAAKSELDPIR